MAETKKTVATATTKAPEVKKVETKVEAKAEVKAPAKKAEVKAAPAKKAAAKKTTAKKAAAKPAAKKAEAKKAPAKKTTAKKAEAKSVVEETFFEINGEQVKVEDIVANIKEAYKNEGHRIGAIKTLRTYVNLAERKAYYVINDKAEDKFVQF